MSRRQDGTWKSGVACGRSTQQILCKQHKKPNCARRYADAVDTGNGHTGELQGYGSQIELRNSQCKAQAEPSVYSYPGHYSWLELMILGFFRYSLFNMTVAFSREECNHIKRLLHLFNARTYKD